jgi:release factor glutamine methyltransferase
VSVSLQGADLPEKPLHDVRLAAVERLRAAGIETPEADARILLQLALGLDEAGLVFASRAAISEIHQASFDRFIERRLAGEPVARIAGYKEFWSRPFRLSADTLVPRPETETLVEAALSVFPEQNKKLRVLDLGTGSGILLAAILLERPLATGLGIDRSESALRVARKNLHALGVGKRAQFVCGDWSAALGQRFDLVVTNPPYIASDAIAALPREVREHDPRLALDGGADGLAAYRKIIAELPYLLSKQGVAVLELGIGQEQSVAALAQAKGLLVKGPARRDLGNVSRALIVYPPIQK